MARNKNSARFNFFFFLIVCGWEGPLAFYLGFSQDNLSTLVGGLIVTVFLWGIFGIDFFKSYIRELRQK